jgi:hypothetical protein
MIRLPQSPIDNSNRNEFLKLIAASFISQIGSHLLTLALAAHIMITTGDPVRSAEVFIASFLPSALVSKFSGKFIDRHISRQILIQTDICALIISVCCGHVIAQDSPKFTLIILLASRSILMFINRSAVTKWIKVTAPGSEQTTRYQLMLLGFFLATAVSGVIAALALGAIGIFGVVLIDVVTYMCGISIMTSLCSVPISLDISTRIEQYEISISQVLQENRTVWIASICVVASQSIFQGAYSVFVTYLPVKVFALGAYGSGLFQVAASAGIIAGFLINRRSKQGIFSKNGIDSWALIGLFALGATLLGLLSIVSLPASVIAFMALNLVYELIWLAASSHTFKSVPETIMAQFQYVQSSVAAVYMSLLTLVFAISLDRYGPTYGPIFTFCGGIFFATSLGVFCFRDAKGENI